MKKYDIGFQSKAKSFLRKNLKQKINFILTFLGIKFLVYKFIYLILYPFLNSNIPFFKKIIFDINKKKSKYIFYDNKEKFLLFTSDQVISKEYFANDSFEFEKLKKVIAFLKPDYKTKKIYDIGANIGVICIPAVSRGLVEEAVAIEPESENFKLLKLNINLNNLDNKIEALNYALSSENDKLLNLEISKVNSGAHRINLPGIQTDEKNQIKSVKSKTFDDLFKNINAKEDLIWIDTQGFEVNILSGAEKMIKSGVPIVIEFWPHALKQNKVWNEMQNIIEKFGFFADLSKNEINLEEINSKSIKKLFSDWDVERPNKHSLFTDLLLLPDKKK